MVDRSRIGMCWAQEGEENRNGVEEAVRGLSESGKVD